MPHRRSPSVAPAFIAALVAVLTLVGALAVAESTVRVAGVFRLSFKVSPQDRMAVDSSRHKGYYFSRFPSPGLWVVDLKRLRLIAHRSMSPPAGPFTVDTIRHKIFFALPVVPGRCDSSAVWVLDGISLTAERRPLPCDPLAGPVAIDALSIDPARSVLSVIGHRGASSVLREMPVRDEGISVSWEVAQRGLCDAGSRSLVARMKHGTAARCASRASGRAIWIPTWHGMPVPDAIGNPIVRVTATGDEGPASILDGRTGRVATVPGDGTVSVYDAPYERLVARMRPAGGREATRAAAAQYAFDQDNGRLYALGAGVVEATDVRAGSATPTALFEFPDLQPSGAKPAVDSRLHRLFVPVGDALIALQDDRPAVAERQGSSPIDAAPDLATSNVAGRAAAGRQGEGPYGPAVVASASPKSTWDAHPTVGIERLSSAAPPAPARPGALRETGLVVAILLFLRMRAGGARMPPRAPPLAA